MPITTATLADRPDLTEAMWNLPNTWPEFMQNDPIADTLKSREPDVPMVDYLARVRPDGLPEDPWVRTHVRLGARIVKVCPVSMTVSGTLAQWRTWSKLPLAESGPVAVPGALSRVLVSVENDHVVYVEPNVWVHHRLG